MPRQKDTRVFDLPQEVYIGQLHKLWTKNSLCDVTVAAGGKKFAAHRLVLSAASQYFEAMFSSGMEESKTGKVELVDVSSLSMDLILNAIYRQNLELNPDIVDDLLAVAHRLEFTEILRCCEEYIINYLISPSNCLYYLDLGEKFDLHRITDSAQQCLLKNFHNVCMNDKFLELSKDALLSYIKSDMLNCESELEVFWAVVRWVQHAAERKPFTAELFQCVRYGLMLPRDLLNEVWKHPMSTKSEDCQDLIKCAIEFHSNPNMKPVITELWRKPRFTEDHLVIVGGRYQEEDVYGECGYDFPEYPPAKILFKFPITSVEKRTMRSISDEMSPMSRTYDSSGASVQIGHYLFIFGGHHKYPDEAQHSSVSASNTCWRFNSVDCVTDQLNNMSLARIYHVAALMDKDKIIVAGGGNDTTDEMDSCEIYNIGRNSWTPGTRLPVRMIYMAACTHNGEVYITGGKGSDSYAALKSVYKYDRHQHIWIPEAEMYQRRMQHVMCSVKGRIYVFGGVSYDGEISTVNINEYFNSETSQWTAFTEHQYFFQPENFASCLVYQDKIYILGGKYAGRHGEHSSIYCFDPQTERVQRSELVYGVSKCVMAVMPFSQRGKPDVFGSPRSSRPRRRQDWRFRTGHRSYSPATPDLGYLRSYLSGSRSRSRSPSRSPPRRSRSRSLSRSSDDYC